MSGDVVPIRQSMPSSATRCVAMDSPRPTATWLTAQVLGMLSIYWQPDEDERVRRLAMGHWIDALQDLPQQAIETAIRERIRSSSRSRPVPGEIREAAQRLVRWESGLPPVAERPFGPTRQITEEEKARCMAMLSQLAQELGVEPEIKPIGVPTLKEIKRVAAAVCDVRPEDIEADRRSGDALMARQLYCLAAKRFTRKSFPQIGVSIERDHTTVVHGVHRAEERIATDEQWAAAWAEIERRLGDGAGA